MFKDGIAVILGRCWHKPNPRLRLWGVDIDSQTSIDAICTRSNGKRTTIEDLSKDFIVERHDDDPERIHIFGYYESDEPLPKLNSGDICELKCDGSHGIMRCSNCLHYFEDKDGNYIEHGNRYKIIGTLEPASSKKFVEECILSKSTVYDGNGYGGNGKAEQSQSQGKKHGELELKKEDIQGITEPIQPYYVDGCRNSIVIGLSGILMREGICEKSTSETIEELANNDGISQQNDIDNALKVVQETYKKDPKDVASKKHFLINVLFPITGGKREIVNEIFSQVFSVILEVQNRNKDKKQVEERIQWLRRNIMSEYAIHTTTDLDEIYLYNERKGIYRTNQEWRLKAFCQSICHDIKTAEINEVIEQVKRRTYTKRSKFDSNIDIINLKNGLLNIHTLKKIDHSPDYLSVEQLPVSYNPYAMCPNISKFLTQVFKREDIPAVLQLVGYCLYKTNKYEKSFFFIGPGGNGKGTFLKILERFLGLNNISHESLQDLAENRFSKAELYGKSANIYADLGRKTLKATGTIKMLTSGDRLSAERKMKQRFEFTPYAKLIFSTNEPPETDDKTYAFWRRLIVFSCENVFEGDKKDPNLIDKLTTPQEMSGLLNLALRALNRLVKNGEFDYTDDIKTIAKEYTQNADSVAKFIDTEYEITSNDEDRILCTELRNTYFNFCKDKGLHCKSDEEFGKALPEGVTRRRPRVRGHPEWHYFGIKPKDKTKETKT
jgi:P4 family phage/plasmid primase-like protien